ncbi:TSUP family transporter, partial [Corynebacterium sp. MC3]
FALAALCASAGGALAVALVSDTVVRPLIIVLLLAVGIFVVCKPSFGEEGNRIITPRRVALGVAVALLVGGYDGVFGPGTGMFLIMAFTAVFSQTFLESAAMAKVVNTATNIGALGVFIAGGYVDWSLAIALAIANVIGAQLGARTVLQGGSKLVRIALLTLVVVLCARLGWQEFVQ